MVKLHLCMPYPFHHRALLRRLCHQQKSQPKHHHRHLFILTSATSMSQPASHRKHLPNEDMIPPQGSTASDTFINGTQSNTCISSPLAAKKRSSSALEDSGTSMQCPVESAGP